MDLGGKTIWNKTSEALSWKYFHESTTTPSTFDKCSSLTTKPMMLKLEKTFYTS
jgi:hypothetical protein